MSSKASQQPYPDVAPRPHYPDLENNVLAFWEQDGTFRASIEQRALEDEFVFNDGPPFANGLPHYGHLLTGFVKDAIPRFQTMLGRRVERRFGWDCHGLPAETESEKELGVSGRQAIVDYGIAAFNEFCRTSVLRYTKAWERYVTRQARWVDFEDDYKTMDLDYMESVLWAFKELHRKGLIFEGERVLPYCWECETPLSNFETRQDDAFRDRLDEAVTVAFNIEADHGVDDELGRALCILVWTTTPWTLPSNLALAVGPELEYGLFEKDGISYVIGTSRADAYRELLGESVHRLTFSGARLVGRRYRPLFPYFADEQNAFVVVGDDFVTLDEGTGVVHLASGFGEDDQRVCEANGIAIVSPVDDRGRFDDRVPDLTGIQVFDANPQIIATLKENGALVDQAPFIHSYPHCWRSDTPLIYRAVSSFFVEVTALKQRMIELNQEVAWFPEHVRDGAFSKWLEGARDWSISRNRFWGAPIPVWKSDDDSYPRIDVYGSIAELEADFGTPITDLHRPFIDELVRPNPDDPSGRSMMRRVTDVLDCWFESGAMPFAQLHFPFENTDRLEAHAPADFICEYVGQTRGWFYTMHVLSTALFDRPAFTNCIAHGVVLGNDGRKLSKRLRNFPDPEDIFLSSGADAMRWYLLSSAVLRGQDVIIEERAMREPVLQVLNPIWNSWYFLSLYGRLDAIKGIERTDQKAELDRYILSSTRLLIEHVRDHLEAYDLAGATSTISVFLDSLTNWYIRRSRERFWRGSNEGDGADKKDAYDTLHTVLSLLCRVVAPLLPFLSETIYKDLTGERSVHLADWPDPATLPDDRELVADMELVREVCSLGHSIRKAQGLRARLPLAQLVVAAPGALRLEAYVRLIKDEVNVKDVRLVDDARAHSSRTLSVIPAVAGPRLGGAIQDILRAVRAGNWKEQDGAIVVEGIKLLPGEYALRVVASDEHAGRVLSRRSGVVVLDCVTTPELEAEGSARDIVRLVQQARKDADLNISDRVALRLRVPEALVAVVEQFVDEIKTQTLAVSLEYSVLEPSEIKPPTRYELPDGRSVAIEVIPRG